MSRPCVAFEMEDANKALQHMDREVIEKYGRKCNGHFLFTWDDGERILYRCKACGGFILAQFSEFHSFNDDDKYYDDFFPVSGPEEAEEINNRYDGWQIEESFPKRWLIRDSLDTAHWRERPFRIT